MSAKPFFKLFFSDLAGDTLHLSDAEFGSYMLLLGAMWNAGGRLPSDPARLARIARCSPKVWGRRWSILASYFDQDDGHVNSARMTREIKKVEHLTAERSAAGKAGNEARWLKSNDTPIANGIAKPSQPEPEPDIEAGLLRAGDGWPEGRPFDHALILTKLAETPNLNIERSPGLGQGIGRLDRWRKDGASWEYDVVPVVTALARKASRVIGTWAYFDAAIGESIAANRRALTIPEHNNAIDPHGPRRPASGHDGRKRGAMEALDAIEGRDCRPQDQGGAGQTERAASAAPDVS